MFNMFFQSLILAIEDSFASLIASLLGVAFIVLFIALLLGIGIYIYSSFAYMAIGKKANNKKPWLAWIPCVGKPLLISKIAKMHWWPVLLLLGWFFASIPILGTIIYYPSMVIFGIFFIIWNWKTYEKVGHKGWFSLFFFIPLLGYIFLGIVAWSKGKAKKSVKRTKK